MLKTIHFYYLYFIIINEQFIPNFKLYFDFKLLVLTLK
jgi:hypothetical protein